MKERKWIWLGAITLITTLIWVALDSYHQLVRADRLGTVKSLLRPLDPKLDSRVLEKIEARKEYQLSEVEKYIRLSVSPTPTPLPPEATSAAEIQSTSLTISLPATESGVSTQSGQRKQ